MTPMRALVLAGAIFAVQLLPAMAQPAMLFWNRTSATIAGLRLAPAGTTRWGPNQCENDADGAVDPGSRLRLSGISPGRYDAEITDRGGRVCSVRGVQVKADRPYAFTIADADLRNCR